MNDTISRQAAIDAIEELISARREWLSDNARDEIKGLHAAICEIQNLPTAEKVGKWIKYKNGASWYCSECTTDDYYAYAWDCNTGEYELQDSYCPNCGARMDEVEK